MKNKYFNLLAAVCLCIAQAGPLFAADRTMPFGEKAFEIFKTVVEMRTAEGQRLVPTLARYLAAEFEKGGFPKADIHVLEVAGTAALVVRYRGDGSLGKKPISISAHMDVVDALREDWERDPFKLIEEDGEGFSYWFEGHYLAAFLIHQCNKSINTLVRTYI